MLNPQTVAQIKACQGVYSVGDTARHFSVSKDTVHRIWTGRVHEAVQAAQEPANIQSSRVPREIVQEDGRLLLERGMAMDEAAEALGVSKTTLYMTLRGETLCF